MKNCLLLHLLLLIPSSIVKSETCFVEGEIVPPPDSSPFPVTLSFFDVQGTKSSPITSSVKMVDGTTPLEEPVSPPQGATLIRVTFKADLPGFDFIPPKAELTPSPRMHAYSITVLRHGSDPNDVYLENLKTAQSVLDTNPEKAAAHAAYAGALATGGNQIIEAGKTEAKAAAAQGNQEKAAETFAKVAENPKFETADESKKKAVLAEWYDTTEKAGKAEAKPDNIDKLTEALKKTDPSFQKKAKDTEKQTNKGGSSQVAKENVLRKWRNSYGPRPQDRRHQGGSHMGGRGTRQPQPPPPRDGPPPRPPRDGRPRPQHPRDGPPPP
jgi:hypothetical protein